MSAIKRLGARIGKRTMFVLIMAGTFMVVCFAITPQTVHLSVGDTSEQVVVSPREVEDTLATSELKTRAREAVSPIYSKNGAQTVTIQEEIENYLSAIDEARNQAYTELDNVSTTWEQGSQLEDRPTMETILTEALIAELSKKMPETMDPTVVRQLMLESDEDWHTVRQQVVDSCNAALNNGVQEETIAIARDGVEKQIDALRVSNFLKSIAMRPVSLYLSANLFYDKTATQEAIRKAEAAVVPVVYRKGQTIIKQGDVVTEDQIAILRQLGMVQGSVNWAMYLGAALLTAVLGGAFLKMFTAQLSKKLTLLCGMAHLVIIVLAALLVKLDPRLVPICFAPMLVSLATDAKTGTMVGALDTVLVSSMSLVTGATTQVVVGVLFSGLAMTMVSAMLGKGRTSRGSLLTTGFFSGLWGSVTYACLGLLLGAEPAQIFQSMGIALGVGLFAGMLCLGTTPIWEQVFQLLTPMKLMELCNPTNPLLHRLAMETPATYYHSTIVGNLAETAAEAIGANPLLTRTAAYYHDVGKLVAPAFFTENQGVGLENPHDHLDPLESARILRNHPLDSYRMILEAGISPQIAQIAKEHHGTAIMQFFYAKASKDGEIEPELYRHTGGKPTTREAALIMLADAVEAATRAGGGNVHEIMHSIVRQRYEDGQLDLVDFTFRDLTLIEEAFDKVVAGIHHRRIQYPKPPEPKKGAGQRFMEKDQSGPTAGGEEQRQDEAHSN